AEVRAEQPGQGGDRRDDRPGHASLEHLARWQAGERGDTFGIDRLRAENAALDLQDPRERPGRIEHRLRGRGLVHAEGDRRWSFEPWRERLARGSMGCD